MNAILNLKTNKLQEKISIETVDHFELMINAFSNQLQNMDSTNYNFEDELLNQAKVMEAARVSNKEKRYVRINEIK